MTEPSDIRNSLYNYIALIRHADCHLNLLGEHMNWPLYYYLGPMCLIAFALLSLYVHFFESITAPCVRRTATEVILLVATIALGFLVVYFNFLDGTSYFAYRDMGSDTVDQYVPYYLDLMRKISTRSLGTWNMNYGLGASFMSYQSWTLDPFCLVIVPLALLLGQQHLSLALVIAQGVKMLPCGLLFDHVLTFYCSRPLSRIVGAVLYAFCGFLMLWGQHYWIGASIVMATLMMLMLELLMQRWSMPRFWGLAVASAVSIIMSTYSGFAVMLFSLAYALLRIPVATDSTGIRSYLSGFWRLALPVACGVLISCVTLVPYGTAMIQESSRVVSSGQAPLSERMLDYAKAFVPLRWLPYLVSRLLGNGLVSVSAELPQYLVPATEAFRQTNVYEMTQMGFSVAAIILLLQFAWWELTEADRREKILVAIASALCICYCVNYFLPALSNVFSAVRYRASFALAAPICIAMAVAWERCFLERRLNIPVFVAGAALTAATLAWSLLHTLDGRLICLYFSLALLILVVLSVIMARNREGRCKLVVVLFAAAMLSSSIVDGFFITNSRVWCTKSDFPKADASYESDMSAALKFIESQDEEGSGTYRISIAMGDLNAALTQGFMGIDSYNSTINSNLELFYKELWPGAIRKISAYQATRDDMIHPTLQRMLGVRYIASRGDIRIDGYEPLASFGSIRVLKAQGQTSLATVFESTTSESSVQSQTPQEREGLVQSSAIVSDNAPKGFQNLGRASGDAITGTSTPAKAHVDSQTSVSCCTSTDSKAVCMFAIPYAKGWSAKVDGTQAPTFRTNYGFIGVALQPGSHKVSIAYRPLGTDIGFAISTSGLVLGLIASIAMLRRQKAGGLQVR